MNTTITSLAFLILSTALLANCSSSSPSSPTATADVTISVLGDRGSSSFSPNPTTITAGQTVSWKNNDGIVHRMVQDTSGFDSQDVSGGGTTNPVTIATRGTITYHCSIHPGMTGTLVVQ
jgi:plastocyanin